MFKDFTRFHHFIISWTMWSFLVLRMKREPRSQHSHHTVQLLLLHWHCIGWIESVAHAAVGDILGQVLVLFYAGCQQMTGSAHPVECCLWWAWLWESLCSSECLNSLPREPVPLPSHQYPHLLVEPRLLVGKHFASFYCNHSLSTEVTVGVDSWCLSLQVCPLSK